MRPTRFLIVTIAVGAAIFSGCHHKKVAEKPPAPPQPAVSAPATPAPTPQSTPAPATPRAATAAPAPRIPNAETRARIDELLAKIEDAYFDYDKHTLRPDAITALQADSKELRDIIVQYPDYKLTIEGHADERGSEEYNMALGEARAESARTYLASVGIPQDQLSLVSYGKDRPFCMDHNESCWQKNRCIHIVASAK
ncbi:MAG: OmpA family protein [Bryobacteraceae bacterium]